LLPPQFLAAFLFVVLGSGDLYDPDMVEIVKHAARCKLMEVLCAPGNFPGSLRRRF
jgi:hypothetical protein